MSDSDDDELAQLRRERERRLGAAGLTVTAQRRAAEEAAGPPPPPAARRARGADSDDGDGEGDGDAIPAGLPTAFGAAPRQQQQQPLAGPGRARAGAAAAGGGPAPAAALDAAEGAGDDDPYGLPLAFEAALEPHARGAAAAVALDPAGARLLSGSTDHSLKLYDFGGMRRDLRAFRSLEPDEGHPVVALSWSPSGDAFLCVTGGPSPRLFDRDGAPRGTFPRGDMYIRDMRNTKGHVSGCTGGAWHPADRGAAATSSDDGTVRVWDCGTATQKTVVKPTLARPGRVAATAVAWAPGGRVLAAGLADGAIQAWDVRGKFGAPAAVAAVPAPRAQMVPAQAWTFVSAAAGGGGAGAAQLRRGAHAAGCEISCLAYSADGGRLLSRATDETLKLWDARRMAEPVAVAPDLPATFANTAACFSPDGRAVATAVSAGAGGAGGAVAFLDAATLRVVRRVGVPGSAVGLAWHPGLRQVFVGCGGRAGGGVRALYDPAKGSARGVLLCAARAPRAADASDYVAALEPAIYHPNALPAFRDMPGQAGGGRKRGAGGAAADGLVAPDGGRTAKALRPAGGAPAPGKGAGGALGTTGGTLLTQLVLKQQGGLKAPKSEDVRAALLRHAGREGDAVARFTDAYAATQPVRQYAQEEGEEEEEEGEAGGATGGQ